MPSPENKVVVVTGASSGIGEGTARVLAEGAALKIDEWNWMIDVNIRGVLHGIAAVLPRMEAQGLATALGHVRTLPTKAC